MLVYTWIAIELLLFHSVIGLSSKVPSDCLMPVTQKLCRASRPMWTYRVEAQTCELFVYGGCGLPNNVFQTEEECYEVCYGLTMLDGAHHALVVPPEELGVNVVIIPSSEGGDIATNGGAGEAEGGRTSPVEVGRESQPSRTVTVTSQQLEAPAMKTIPKGNVKPDPPGKDNKGDVKVDGPGRGGNSVKPKGPGGGNVNDRIDGNGKGNTDIKGNQVKVKGAGPGHGPGRGPKNMPQGVVTCSDPVTRNTATEWKVTQTTTTPLPRTTTKRPPPGKAAAMKSHPSARF